jgi:hypothetical protein
MNKFLSALIAALLAVGFSSAYAETAAPAHKKAVKKPAKNAKAKAEAEPDVSGATPTEYSCDENEKITIYRLPNDDKQVVMRWNKHLHKMARVETDTGADRYESKSEGLTWVGVPAKAMLFDAKKGQRLANECKKQGQ